MRITRLLLTTSFAVVSSEAAAQAPVDAPQFKVGDRWTFSMLNKQGGEKSTWSREIVEVTPEAKLRVRMGRDKMGDYDAAMNFVSADGRVRELVRYPAKPGDQWDKEGALHQLGVYRVAEKVSARVVGEETVTVPAGTFKCLRVEAEVAWGVARYSARNVITRWYCPEVKWIAKEVIEEDVNNPGGAASHSHTVRESELVKFVPGG